MKRALLFVLPQALLVPFGFCVGLFVGVIVRAGGWAAAAAQATGGGGGPGPAHGGGGLLLVVAAALAILLLAIASTITMAGITAGLMGAMYGFVASCLLDWLILLRRPLAPGDVRHIKRWAGRGAVAMSVFCTLLALSNPLRDIAGVWAVTGMFVCLGGAFVGVARVAWARWGRGAK